MTVALVLLCSFAAGIGLGAIAPLRRRRAPSDLTWGDFMLAAAAWGFVCKVCWRVRPGIDRLKRLPRADWLCSAECAAADQRADDAA